MMWTASNPLRSNAAASIVLPLVATVLALSAPALSATFQLAVDRDGLKWSADCGATIFPAGDPNGDEVATLASATESIDLPNGKYEVVVSCPSTEGTLTQTVPFQVKRDRDVQLPVKLRPTFVVATVKRNGTEVPGKMKIIDAYGRTVASGKDHSLLVVPPGKYTLRGVVPKKVSGQRRAVSAEMPISTAKGKKISPVLDASDGELLLTLVANRKNVEGTGTLLNAKRKKVAEVTAGEVGPVPPGTYTLVTQLYVSHDFAEVRTKNVTIRPGKTEKRRVTHPVGLVTPLVLMDKKAPKDPSQVDVQIFKGAAPKSFNAIAADEVATLSPGTYRFVARLKKKRYSDKSAWTTEATVKLKAGQRKKAVLDLTPARLTVTTQVGGEAKPLMVRVFRPDKEAPLFSKRAGSDATLTLELPPQRYRVVAELEAPQGVMQAEVATSLKRGQRTTRDLSVNVGSATVQVFEKEVAVPAEVLFYRTGAAAPAAVVKAGQKVYLEPGPYALSTRRGGKEKTFSPITVAAGRHIDRKLELTIGKDKAAVPAPAKAKTSAPKKKADPRKKAPGKRTEVDDILD